MSNRSAVPARQSARAADTPVELPRSAWPGIIRRTVREFRQDDCTDWAAALT